MAAKTKKQTTGISLNDADKALLDRLKLKTKIFQTSALIRRALQVFAQTEGMK